MTTFNVFVIPFILVYSAISIFTIMLYSGEVTKKYLDTCYQLLCHLLMWPLYLPYVYISYKIFKWKNQ